jgi:hypothetical protein
MPPVIEHIAAKKPHKPGKPDTAWYVETISFPSVVLIL